MNDQCHLVTQVPDERPHDEPIIIPKTEEVYKFLKEGVETLWDTLNQLPPAKE